MSYQSNTAIIRASFISIVGNAALAVLKLVAGFWTGSLAVVGDGIDSSMDIVMSIIMLITARISNRPPDIQYAFGYKKADTIAAKALSFIIFFAGAQLAVTTIGRFFGDRPDDIPDIWAIVVTIVSIAGKLLLSLYQFRVGKKANSPMLIANAKNMKNDVVISVSVLAGLFFTITLKLPVIDLITALAVSLWIMKVAYDIFRETNVELMDGVEDPTVYKLIFEAIEKVKEVRNPHRVRSRQINGMHMIVVDIEVDGTTSLYRAHEIAHDVEESIRHDVQDIYDIVVHVEPFGDMQTEKPMGIKREDIV